MRPAPLPGLSPQLCSRLRWGELSFLRRGSGSHLGRVQAQGLSVWVDFVVGRAPQGLCVLAGGLGAAPGSGPCSQALSPLATAECSAGLCVSGGSCEPSSAQLCHCPQGPHGPYGECSPARHRGSGGGQGQCAGKTVVLQYPHPAPCCPSEAVGGGASETPPQQMPPHPLTLALPSQQCPLWW